MRYSGAILAGSLIFTIPLSIQHVTMEQEHRALTAALKQQAQVSCEDQDCQGENATLKSDQRMARLKGASGV